MRCSFGVALKIICVLVIVFCICLLAYGIVKSKKRIRTVTVTALSGGLALFAVHFTSSFTAINMPISTLSLSTAVLLGIPGVILQLFLNLIWS